MYKRIIITIIFLIVSRGPCFADRPSLESVVTATRDTTIAVPGTQQICTKAIPTLSFIGRTGDEMGVMYKATSGGSINLSMDLQQSYTTPTTEGINDSEYVTTDSVDDSIKDNIWHIATLDTVIMPYVRFVIKGATGNHDSTEVQIKVVK